MKAGFNQAEKMKILVGTLFFILAFFPNALSFKFWSGSSPAISVQVNLYETVTEQGERALRELEEGLWKVGIDGQDVTGFALKVKGAYILCPFLALTVDSKGSLRRVKLHLQGKDARQVASIMSDDTTNEQFFQPIRKSNLKPAYFVKRYPLERSYFNGYRFPPFEPLNPSHVHRNPPSGHARPNGGQPSLSRTNSIIASPFPTVVQPR